MTVELGIDAHEIEKSLNRVLHASITRIRRCVAVKEKALEKIREDNPEDRAYGFRHLNWIIELQLKSYPRYARNISDFLKRAKPLSERILDLRPLESGMAKRIAFDRSRKSLQKTLAKTEEAFDHIMDKTDHICKLVEGQKQLATIRLTGEDEARLRHLLEGELEDSRELTSTLKGCMKRISRMINAMQVLQIRFVKYLGKTRKMRGSNLIDDSEVMCDRIEEYISAFYAFKSYIQILGLAVGFLVPVKEISVIGFAVAGGAFAFDFVMDFIAGLPETRRRIYQFTRRIDDGEARRKKLTAEVLAYAAKLPSMD